VQRPVNERGAALDEDDKIRRNLVVASVAVVLVWWLDVPLSLILAKFGDTGRPLPFVAWRVWAAVLVILLYLILRYRFAPDTTEAIRMLRENWRHRRNLETQALLRRQLARFTKTGADSSVFAARLPQLVENYAREVAGHRNQQLLEVPRPTLTIFSFKAGDDWGGRIEIQMRWAAAGSHAGGDRRAEIDFLFEGTNKAYVLLRTTAHIAVYSEGSTRLLLPALFVYVALLIVLANLSRAVFAVL